MAVGVSEHDVKWAGNPSKSVGSNANSDAIYVKGSPRWTVQMVVATAGVGTFTLQSSNDAGRNDTDGSTVTNWDNIPDASVAISAAGSVSIHRGPYGCPKWIRVVWTGSGAGTMTGRVLKGDM